MNTETPVSRRPSPVAELRTSNTYAVVLMDRRWATAAIVHKDPLGSLYPFQHGTAMTAEAAGGTTHALMADAVSRAWRDMAAKGPVRYDKCILCVAPSLTKSRDAASRIAIEPARDSASSAPRVTPGHVAALKAAICTQNVSASSTVTELVAMGYRDDGGHELPDPVGAVTTSLELRAHLVMTDQAVTVAAMDALRRMRVRVHAVVSPCAAAAANAGAAAAGDAVSIEVSEDDITGTIIRGGRIARTFVLSEGANDLTRAAAKQLGTLSRTLSEWLAGHHDLLVHGRADTPLASAHPPGHPPPATLDDLQESAGEAARKIAVSIRDAIGRAMPSATGWPVLVTGDDRFACRTITPALRKHGGLDAMMRVPDRIHGEEFIAAPGLTRTVGALRYWSTSDTSATIMLEAYYERHAPSVTRAFRTIGRQADTWRRRGTDRMGLPRHVQRIARTLRALLF